MAGRRPERCDLKISLLDAGPLVALYDRSSFAHAHYVGLLADRRINWRLCTTWPCVVEACHFLRADLRGQMLRWLERGGASVFPFDQGHLGEMADMMQRYTEFPRTDMDFADASLVWLASETKVTACLLYTSPSPRDGLLSRMPSSA